MKITLITVSILFILSIAFLLILGKYSQKGQAPGLVDGRLSRCSEKPNCVCSEYAGDSSHFVEPVADIHDAQKQDMEKVITTLREMDGDIQMVTDNYIAATFKSSIFGFMDDMEIRFDSDEGVLHIRSASRVGYSDGGVNGKRVESFKRLYRKMIDETAS